MSKSAGSVQRQTQCTLRNTETGNTLKYRGKSACELSDLLFFPPFFPYSLSPSSPKKVKDVLITWMIETTYLHNEAENSLLVLKLLLCMLHVSRDLLRNRRAAMQHFPLELCSCITVPSTPQKDFCLQYLNSI